MKSIKSLLIISSVMLLATDVGANPFSKLKEKVQNSTFYQKMKSNKIVRSIANTVEKELSSSVKSRLKEYGIDVDISMTSVLSEVGSKYSASHKSVTEFTDSYIEVLRAVNAVEDASSSGDTRKTSTLEELVSKTKELKYIISKLNYEEEEIIDTEVFAKVKESSVKSVTDLVPALIDYIKNILENYDETGVAVSDKLKTSIEKNLEEDDDKSTEEVKITEKEDAKVTTEQAAGSTDSEGNKKE